MPQVPVQTTQQVVGEIHPAYDNVSASPDAFGAQVGAATQRVGAAGQQASDAMSQAAVAFQGLQNETDAKQADIALATKLTNLQFDPQNGYGTKLGKDAVDGYQDFQNSVQQAYQDARSSLPNPAAQRMFDNAAVKRVEYSLSSGAQHAAQQNKIWQIGTADARANLELNVAANYYNDDNRFAQAIATVNDEAVQLGELQGWSSEQVAAKQADYVSKAWTQRILRVTQNNPVAGQAMYDQNQQYINAAERPNLEHYLKVNVQPVLAANIVNSVTSGGSIGIRNNNPGNLKDPKTGQFQSFATQQEGIAAADANLLAYQTKHGINTIDGIVNRWAPSGDGNNNPTAYAASVSKATGFAPDQQIDLSDKATRTKVLNAMFNVETPGWQAGGGTAPTNPDPRVHLADWEQQASAAAESVAPNDPQFRDMVVSHLFNQVNKIVAGQQGQQMGARDSLVAAALGSTGGPKPTTLNDLLSNPDMRAAWATLRPEQQVGVMDLIEHNAKNTDPPINDQALSTFYRLKGEAANDQTAFANEDLTKYFDQLPHSMTEQLINLQAAATGRAERDQTKAMNLEHAMAVARPPLQAAGVHIPTAKDSPDKAQDYNTFTGRMAQSLDDFYNTNKRAPNDGELRDITNSLLTQGVDTSKTSGHLWWSGPAPARAFQTDPGSFQIPAPDAEKSKIVAAYQSVHPGQTPSDSIINQIYTQSQLAAKKPVRTSRPAAPAAPASTSTVPNPFASNQ
ncbi:hypothetical protein BX589_12069 [Paraburkholderia fungorum]|nr:hypothetical protein BX589_12069 [Paraburkholderia fungorum]